MINLLTEKEVLELMELLGKNINNKDKMLKILEKKEKELEKKYIS
tara:strand:+ start:3389 stop:3523 length:135 start_codon:yes stop_codon:yes gene_type:complete